MNSFIMEKSDGSEIKLDRKYKTKLKCEHNQVAFFPQECNHVVMSKTNITLHQLKCHIRIYFSSVMVELWIELTLFYCWK